MGFCAKCGKEISEYTVICPNCGCAVGEMAKKGGKNFMKYCSKCGNEMMDEAIMCTKCGCMVENIGTQAVTTDDKLQKLSSRLMINGIIWICIAVLQIIIGLAGIAEDDYELLFTLFIGIVNLISAAVDIKLSKDMMNKPVDIVKRCEPLAGPIVTLIYNLILGGVIGVIGSIYYLVGIRNYVMENKDFFLQKKLQDAI